MDDIWTPKERQRVEPVPVPVQAEVREAALEAEPFAGDLKAVSGQFSRMALGIALMLLCGSAAQILIAALVRGFAPWLLENDWMFWLIMQGPLYLVGVPVCLLVMPKKPETVPALEKMTAGRFIPLIFIAWVMMYAGNLVGNVFNMLFTAVVGVEVTNPVETIVSLTSMAPMAMLVVVIGPIVEEFIFRKVLIDRMRPYGEKTAVLVSALIFGLFHGNLSQFFYAACLGTLFGYVYLRTGKMRWSLILHMFINFMGSVVGVFVLNQAAGMEEKLELLTEMLSSGSTSGVMELLGGFLVIALYGIAVGGMLIGGLVCFLLKRKQTHFLPAPMELPRGTVFRTVFCNWGTLVLLLSCLGLVVMSLL